jgi:hypothetical protein
MDEIFGTRKVGPCTPDVLLVMSADGKGIVMRPDALRPATAKTSHRTHDAARHRLLRHGLDDVGRCLSVPAKHSRSACQASSVTPSVDQTDPNVRHTRVFRFAGWLTRGRAVAGRCRAKTGPTRGVQLVLRAGMRSTGRTGPVITAGRVRQAIDERPLRQSTGSINIAGPSSAGDRKVKISNDTGD